MADETSSEARDGLASFVQGQRKTAAGAVTGNDSLTAEGQLKQAAARARQPRTPRQPRT